MIQIDPRRLVEHPWMPVVVAAVLAGVAYVNAYGGEFVFDDLFLVRDAGYIRNLSSFPEMIAQMAQGKGFGYRPVRTFTHMIEFQIFGLQPWGYHLTNILLHVLVCWLLFELLVRMGLERAVALVSMAIFAIHPVHTEAVTYISGRRDLLYTLFFCAGALSYVQGVTRDRKLLVFATLPLYALSVFSKEMGITLPAVLYLWDMFVHRRDVPWPRRIWAPIKGQPVFWSLLWTGAIAFFVYRGILVPRTLQPHWWGGTIETNFATVLAVHVRYLAVQLWPVDLLADYTPQAFDIASGWLDARSLIGVALLGCSIALAWLLVKKNPMATVGILAYWVILLPVSHVIPHHELAAEHHLYLPSLVMCASAAAVLVALWRKRPWFAVAMGTTLGIALVALTLSRNEDWRNEEALWTDTVTKAPRCGRALLNLASVYLDRGDFRGGELLLRESLKYTDHPKSRAYLGNSLTKTQRYEEANEILTAGLKKYPEDRFVIRFHALNLRFMGKEAEAQQVLLGGIELHPRDPDLRFILAGSYVMDDRPEEALQQYLVALEIRPEDEDSRKGAILVAGFLGREGLVEKLEREAVH